MDINEYLEYILSEFDVRHADLGARGVCPSVIYEVTDVEPGFLADNRVVSEVFTARLTVYAHTAKQSWDLAEEVKATLQAEGWIEERMTSAGFDGAFMTEVVMCGEVYVK